MNARWLRSVLLRRLLPFDQSLDVLRHDRCLCGTPSGGLSRPCIGDVANCEHIRIPLIEELHGRLNTDESVVRVDQRVWSRGRQAIEEAVIRCLARGEDDEFCRYFRTIRELDIECASVIAESIWWYNDARTSYESVID